jgi:uncharacterized membrane protein YjjB (DUF3815 family)
MIDTDEFILLLVCIATGCIGMATRLLGDDEFKNGGKFARKMLLSFFLSILIFLSSDALMLVFTVPPEKLAWFKVLACLLGAGYYHQVTLERMDVFYMNYILNKLPKEGDKKNV